MKVTFPKDFAHQPDFEVILRTLWQMSKNQNEDLELRLDFDYYRISPTAQIEPFLVHIMGAK